MCFSPYSIPFPLFFYFIFLLVITNTLCSESGSLLRIAPSLPLSLITPICRSFSLTPVCAFISVFRTTPTLPQPSIMQRVGARVCVFVFMCVCVCEGEKEIACGCSLLHLPPRWMSDCVCFECLSVCVGVINAQCHVYANVHDDCPDL